MANKKINNNRTTVKSETKEWTVMVYMAGDNNLSIDMVYALEQLKIAADGNLDINLFVYFDGLSSDVPTLYCDFSTPKPSNVKFYQSHKIKNKLIDVKDEFNENSAAINNIINFVHWCVSRDTAEVIEKKKYAFIFSGHTFGFVNKGLFKDEKANYYMTHAKLKYMFERITSTEEELRIEADKDENDYRKKYGRDWSDKRQKERTTSILGKRLDLLGFDTCVMSTLEIGCQFRKFAKTMVASEGSIPTAGWNYAQILLSNIDSKSKTDPTKLAVSFVDEFIKQQNKFALADISVDISAWNLEKMYDLEQAFKKLAENLLECFKAEESAAYQQMKRLIVYAHWQCQTYLLEQHIDLGDFCQLMIKEINLLEKEISEKDLAPISEVREACHNVVGRIRDCIMLTGFSGSDFQFSNGISLFFPWSWVCYLSAAEDYNNLTFIKENEAGKKWNEFLIKYLSEVTLRLPNPPTKLKDITPDTTSVIYKSYSWIENPQVNGDNGSRGAGGQKSGKQFPNSARQFPNSARQFPNSARLTDEISIFLSRFMKLKNNKFNWNWAGFTSNTVAFRPKLSNEQDKNSRDKPRNKIVIDIPAARPFEDEFNEIDDKLDEIKRRPVLTGSVENVQRRLREIYAQSDDEKVAKLVDNFSKLRFLKSNSQTEEELKSEMEQASSLLDSEN